MIEEPDLARLHRAALTIARVVGLARRVDDHVRGVRWQKTASFQEPPSGAALAALLRSVATDALLVAAELERR